MERQFQLLNKTVTRSVSGVVYQCMLCCSIILSVCFNTRNASRHGLCTDKQNIEIGVVESNDALSLVHGHSV